MNVLIALVGMTPAVVTETIWALAHHGVPEQEKFKPDRIVLVTTGEGKHQVEDVLLSPSHGQQPLTQLINDIALDGACARLGDGLEILCPSTDSENDDADEDVHAPDELDRMGDLLFATIRKYANKPDTRICVSLSGGRKTMSHLAGQCLSLLARPQDFLTHVIVKPESLERCARFFYPEDSALPFEPAPSEADPTPKLVERLDDIDVRLTRVPFVRLGSIQKVKAAVQSWAGQGFTCVVSASNIAIGASEPMKLVYRKKDGKVFLGGHDIERAIGIDGKKCLNAAGRQIAALRMITRSEGVTPKLDEGDFREFMRFWWECTTARAPENKPEEHEKVVWWTSFCEQFIAPAQIHPAAPDPDFRFQGGRFSSKPAVLSPDVSKLSNAFEATVRSFDTENYRIPDTKKGGRYKLPPTLIFIRED